MQSLWVDTAYICLKKHSEETCGDHVEVFMDGDCQTTMVLADGLGSGVKANILSTLTAKILCTMVSKGMELEECLDTMISSLPICNERNIAYSTFSILKVQGCQKIDIIQYDNPPVIFLREGKNFDYKKDEKFIADKVIYESRLQLKLGDLIVAVSDGAEYAGTERTFNYNWVREDIIKYLEDIYDPSLSSNLIASMLSKQCDKLYAGKPSDDTTVAVIRIVKKQVVNIFFGPPEKVEDDNKAINLFMAKEGKKILCGGTTAKMFSENLGLKLKSDNTGIDQADTPPLSQMEGFDLITEGIYTMSKVLENMKYNKTSRDMAMVWKFSGDGISELTHILLDEATNINFFVGKAMNPAHSNPHLKINFHMKEKLVEELKTLLEELGKVVNVSYF